MVGVHLLPMVVFGLLANIFAALLQHRVSNKLLMGIGATAYIVAFTLGAVQREGDSYWAFSFPALSLCVIGADIQFVVGNVSRPTYLYPFRTNCNRCMFCLRCPPINNQSQAHFFKLSRAFVPPLVMASLPQSLIRCSAIPPHLVIMPTMP